MADIGLGGLAGLAVGSAPHAQQQPAQHLDALPVLGAHDDLSKDMPANPTPWQRVRFNPVARRVVRVMLALVVTAVLLLVVNLACAPRKVMPCATPADCRDVQRVNTVLAGVRTSLNLLVCFVAVFVVLGFVGVDTRTLLAAAGILAIIIGLAALPVIRNFVSALSTVTADAYALGDLVVLQLKDAADVRGIVTAFSAQRTQLRETNGALLNVPNNAILVVKNLTPAGGVRAQVDVQVPRAVPVDVATGRLQRMLDAVNIDPAFRDTIVSPAVVKGVVRTSPLTYTVALTVLVQPHTQTIMERSLRAEALRAMQEVEAQTHGAASASLHAGALDEARVLVDGGDAREAAASSSPPLRHHHVVATPEEGDMFYDE